MKSVVTLLVLLFPSVSVAQFREKIIYTQQDPIVSFEIAATGAPSVKLEMRDIHNGVTLKAEYHPAEVRSWLTENAGGRAAAESLFARKDTAAMDERFADLSGNLGHTVITALMRTSEKRRVQLSLAMKAGDETALLLLTNRQGRALLDGFRRASNVADSMLAASGRTDPRMDSIAQARRDSIVDTAPMASSDIAPVLLEEPVFPLPIPGALKGFVLNAKLLVDTTGHVEAVSFPPTPGQSYDARIEATLRALRFRPGMKPNGTRMRSQYDLIFPF